MGCEIFGKAGAVIQALPRLVSPGKAWLGAHGLVDGSASPQPSLRGLEVCGATGAPQGWQIGFPVGSGLGLAWICVPGAAPAAPGLWKLEARGFQARGSSTFTSPASTASPPEPRVGQGCPGGSGGLNPARPGQESLAGPWDAGSVPRDPPDLVHCQQLSLEVTWMRLCWSRAGAVVEWGRGGESPPVPSLPIPAAVPKQGRDSVSIPHGGRASPHLEGTPWGTEKPLLKLSGCSLVLPFSLHPADPMAWSPPGSGVRDFSSLSRNCFDLCLDL